MPQKAWHGSSLRGAVGGRALNPGLSLILIADENELQPGCLNVARFPSGSSVGTPDKIPQNAVLFISEAAGKVGKTSAAASFP